mgnify:FL=1
MNSETASTVWSALLDARLEFALLPPGGAAAHAPGKIRQDIPCGHGIRHRRVMGGMGARY